MYAAGMTGSVLIRLEMCPYSEVLNGEVPLYVECSRLGTLLLIHNYITKHAWFVVYGQLINTHTNYPLSQFCVLVMCDRYMEQFVAHCES